jgi:putative NADH-flavin reductase
MRLALYGAGGTIGRRITQEALQRGHRVTAIGRDPAKLEPPASGLAVLRGDVLEPVGVARAVAGHDAVISAVGAGNGPSDLVVRAAHSLIEGLSRAGVRRLLVVGGAGSLEVAPGVQLVDAPDFPAEWRAPALAHRDALAVYRTADVDWTYFSPPAILEPGERTGRYRTGRDQLLTNADGKSRISAEDFAVALLDEVERPRHLRERITVADA